MSAKHQHLPVAEVKPGMVLFDVLLDKQGQVLLPEGAVLTASMIALLPRHGIETLAVVSGPADTAPAAVAATQSAFQERLDYLFRKNTIDDAHDWATGILRRYVEDYRLEREIEP
ncbi:MAG: hypothetical protein V4582_17945 [Pseudomonadota bacterium]